MRSMLLRLVVNDITYGETRIRPLVDLEHLGGQTSPQSTKINRWHYQELEDVFVSSDPTLESQPDTHLILQQGQPEYIYSTINQSISPRARQQHTSQKDQRSISLERSTRKRNIRIHAVDLRDLSSRNRCVFSMVVHMEVSGGSGYEARWRCYPKKR